MGHVQKQLMVIRIPPSTDFYRLILGPDCSIQGKTFDWTGIPFSQACSEDIF